MLGQYVTGWVVGRTLVDICAHKRTCAHTLTRVSEFVDEFHLDVGGDELLLVLQAVTWAHLCVMEKMRD